jgi:hypothetical protein
MTVQQFISKHGTELYTYFNPLTRTLQEESDLLDEYDRWEAIEQYKWEDEQYCQNYEAIDLAEMVAYGSDFDTAVVGPSHPDYVDDSLFNPLPF